jgi:hypothetical protein
MDRKQKILISIIFTLIIIFSTILLSGCTENSPTNNIPKGIVGVWSNEKIQNDITYRYVYEFYSNLSCLYTAWDSNTNSYTVQTRGTYEMNEEYLYLTTPGVHTKWEVLVFPYLISEDGNELRLYYGETEEYELFIRES